MTIQDICRELEKPGRDPRPEFKTASLKEGVEKISDLAEGMRLQGTVSNVTNFGAFVDIGVHQDGLVHISALADKFVKDPHEVVKTGDIVNVRVLEVDLERKRIALTMRSEDKNEVRESKNIKAKVILIGTNRYFHQKYFLQLSHFKKIKLYFIQALELTSFSRDYGFLHSSFYLNLEVLKSAIKNLK